MDSRDKTVILTETDEAHDLTPFVKAESINHRNVDPGGFGSAEFDLSRKVDARNFEDYAEVAIYDSSSGELLFNGGMLNPGRGVAVDGEQVWKMSILGEGVRHSQERRQPYGLIDSEFEPWRQGFQDTDRLNWEQATEPDNEERAGLLFKASAGTVNIGDASGMNYGKSTLGNELNGLIGAFTYERHMKRATSNNRQRAILFNTSGLPTTVHDDAWGTGFPSRNSEIGTQFVDDDYGSLQFRYDRQTSALVITDDDEDWAHLAEVSVVKVRLDRQGNRVVGGGAYLPGAGEVMHVKAHDGIIDLWATMCPRFDLENARIDEGTIHHTQLKWKDGATAYEIMGDLMAAEPTFTWAVWERQPNGKYRAEWILRDAGVRYDFYPEEGFEKVGSEQKRVLSVWAVGQNAAGRYGAQEVTPDFEDAYTRGLKDRGISPTTTEAYGLPFTPFDVDNAVTVAKAQAQIEDSKYLSTASTLNISRRVYDHKLGRWITPDKVIPGFNARVLRVHDELNSLNHGESDQFAVFRVLSTESNREGTRMELNAPDITEIRAIAALIRETGVS